MIRLYTTHCPKCNVLEKKLQQKQINYEISTDVNEMIKLGFLMAPILQVNADYYEFSQAVEWVNKQ